MGEQLACPVYLVGFMGAGKTSTGRHLACAHALPLVDADAFVEARAGKPIARIFAEEGEEAFRALETDALEQLSIGTPRLISCGGGAVVRAANVHTMKRHGFVVYLHVTAEEAAARIADASTRPLFTSVQAARARIAERLPWYRAAADVEVDTVGKLPAQVAEEVAALLRQAGVLVAR